MKRPPAAASKIVTLTISPIPKWKARGGRRSVKEFENLGSYRARVSTTAGVRLTNACGRLAARPGTASVLADITSVLAGPLAGIREQPPRRKADATMMLLPKYRTRLLPLALPIHPLNRIPHNLRLTRLGRAQQPNKGATSRYLESVA